ncbi:uncharacterized protein BDW47DRAFT_101475 [Aspergillus candidus]|uniref:Uncharacterized protein n=1 Tax=Aspergillus candidus TaxID=41067 RepID=A0A2I2FHN2_ASPCN|nr:hypothetical protein BDW47DRAFT_101475 [Aspergillus candidus]PLB40147.1 hypothetical protein BDW47DRAFT_101475 [Aspergillus candidus]
MAAAHLPPGSLAPAPPTNEEVQEYVKILKISDDIFSGTHPRLKVPQHLVRKPASHAPASVPTQVKPSEQPGSSITTLSQAPSTPAQLVNSQATAPVDSPSAATAGARTIPKPVSEIDPIFLTKSDDLVRAELQLQRQRLERTLREQLDQRKQESRHKASLQDTKPDFDVSDVLVRAFEMVKPSPSVDVPATGATSDSFDDNSFYSSRAPDSPQQGPPQPSLAPAMTAEEPIVVDSPAENYSDELQRLEALNRNDSDQEMHDTYPVADPRLPHRVQRPPHHAEGVHRSHKHQEPQQAVEAVEEPEYSPPAPGVAPMERQEGPDPQRDYLSKQRGPDGRQYDRARYNRRSISPRNDIRVVQNHITSPAAPQPSRVSPLAIAKVPSVHQLRDLRPGYGPDNQASPHHSPQSLMPRKRRRLQGDRAPPGQAPYRPQAGGATEPQIKEEPVSPPPFVDAPPMFRSRPTHERPIYIDAPSPRYTPVYQRMEPPSRDPAYEVDPYEIQGDLGAPRTVSQLGARRSMRDDQDLRRVASLQHARQPDYQREYVDQISPRAMRAASYAIVDPSPQERTRYYEEPPPPQPARRYIAAGEQAPSPRYREAYYEEEPVNRLVAAPTRRIIVDEQGNQYYEASPPPRIQAMAPPPTARVPRNEIYEDRPPAMHQPSSRAPSVVEDPYGSRRYVQEMPPPPSAYRRVADYARPSLGASLGERRPYATPMDDREPYPRSNSVQVADYSVRRQVPYVEEPDIPRGERIVRMPSVRPPTSRHEEPREVIQRVESVRPAGQEMGVYLDDGSRRPREYIERPMYVSARPVAREERYYDPADPERMVLDRGRDVVHRVPQRYQ